MVSFSLIAAIISVSATLAGCMASSTAGSHVDGYGRAAGALSSNTEGLENSDRLLRLYQLRSAEHLGSEYPLGPDDLLEISVPDIPELKHCEVRVAGNGTAIFPTIGLLQIGGKTEHTVQKEIRQHLNKYLIDPQFNLTVKKYQSRVVAVAGLVANPGLYQLTSTSETILDVLNQAGGPMKDAGQRILLIPAASDSPLSSPRPASEYQEALSRGAFDRTLTKTEALSIDARALDRGDSQAFLSMPARPGDVIFVPEAGDVMVQGWVTKPGDYKITPGLTVQGAVAAAGGPLFAADTDSTRLIRINRNGEKLTSVVNLEDGNIPVQENDVIDVPYSAVKVVPYGVASLISRIGIGASLGAL